MQSESDLSITEILEMVIPFFKGNRERAILWMLAQNEHLGNISPVDMFHGGNGEKLAKWIENRLSENEL